LADRKLEADQAQLIDDLARALPPDERQAAARAARSLLQEGRASALDLYVGAVMLLALDEDAEGLTMLRRAMRQAPNNAPVKRRLENALETERRYRELVEVFGPFVSDRAVVQESQLSALAEAH